MYVYIYRLYSICKCIYDYICMYPHHLVVYPCSLVAIQFPILGFWTDRHTCTHTHMCVYIYIYIYYMYIVLIYIYTYYMYIVYIYIILYIYMYILLWVFWFPILSANLNSIWEHHCRSGNLGYCSLPCYRAHAAGQCPARPEAEKPAKKPRNQEPRDHLSPFCGAFNAGFFHEDRDSPTFQLSWFITPITMVYGTYNHSYWGL